MNIIIISIFHLNQILSSIYLIGAILEIIDEDGLMDFQNILITPEGEDGVDPIA